MAGIERRIAALEGLIQLPPPRKEVAERRQLLWRALDAMAHVKRSSIDPEQWRYSVEKLR